MKKRHSMPLSTYKIVKLCFAVLRQITSIPALHHGVLRVTSKTLPLKTVEKSFHVHYMAVPLNKCNNIPTGISI